MSLLEQLVEKKATESGKDDGAHLTAKAFLKAAKGEDPAALIKAFRDFRDTVDGD